MKEWLTQHIGLKIAMLLLAIPVWLILVNVANPMATKTISGVEVHLLHADSITDNDQIYTITSGKTVTLQVTARKKNISDITEEDFYVYADMQYSFGQDANAQACQIQYQIVKDTDIIDSDYVSIKGDDMLMFTLEDVISRDFAVKVNYTGEMNEDVTIGATYTDPDTITIKGAESELASIATVAVIVDQSKIDSDTTSVSGKIHLYNSNGREITDTSDLQISALTVDVIPEVLKTKTLTLTMGEVSGTPAEGYGYTGLSCDVSGVKVIGLKAALAELTTIQIPDTYLNIEGATEDVTVEVNLADLLPENVNLADENDLVKITLSIEKLQTKTYKLPTSDIVVKNQQEDLYTYTFLNKTVLVSLEGFAEDLDSISVDDIIATIDVGDCQEGSYDLPLDIADHDGFTLAEEPTVGIRVQKITVPSEKETEEEAEPESKKDTEAVTETAPETSEEAVTIEETEETDAEETETSAEELE